MRSSFTVNVMSYTPSISASVACLIFGLFHNAQAAQPEIVATAERPRLALYAEDVTMNGQVRLDLARALADSLSTALIRRGQVRVFSLETAAGQDATGILAAAQESKTSRVSRLMDEGLDYVMTFSVMGIGDECLMSVKKTRARTHEVIEARQYRSHGNEAELFKLIDGIVDDVDPRPKAPAPFPRTQSPASLAPVPLSEFVVVPEAEAYDPFKQNLAPEHDLTTVRKALVYRELGTVNHIDNTWKFCIIRPIAGTDFAEHDPLHVLWDEGDVYAALRVCAIERGAIVADMGKTPDHHPLFRGDKVFGWAPPIKR
jgi:hypothetical protein